MLGFPSVPAVRDPQLKPLRETVPVEKVLLDPTVLDVTVTVPDDDEVTMSAADSVAFLVPIAPASEAAAAFTLSDDAAKSVLVEKCVASSVPFVPGVPSCRVPLNGVPEILVVSLMLLPASPPRL